MNLDPSDESDVPTAAVQARVLIADDNQDATASLARLLSLWGHQVSVAHDGTQALASFRCFRPDIVLLDIEMPGDMNGHETAKRMLREGSPPLLIAVTGYGRLEDRQRSLEAGFKYHFTKPVDLRRLRQVIEHALRWHE